MKRVIILGPGGAGKTTLVQRRSRITGIPHIEIDAISGCPDLSQHRQKNGSSTAIFARMMSSSPVWAPSIAEVDDRRDGTLEFRARFYLTPRDRAHTHVFAAFGVRGRGPIIALKAWTVERMLGRIVAQDRAVLQSLTDNVQTHGQSILPLIVPQDLIRRGIEAVLRGDVPSVPSVLPEIVV